MRGATRQVRGRSQAGDGGNEKGEGDAGEAGEIRETREIVSIRATDEPRNKESEVRKGR